MEPELGLDRARLASLHDVGVLIIEPALVHLAIIDVEPRANFIHGARVARLNALSRQMLGRFPLVVQHGSIGLQLCDGRVQEAGRLRAS